MHLTPDTPLVSISGHAESERGDPADTNIHNGW